MLPNSIDLTATCFELNVKNPAFAQQENSSNAKGFLWRTK